MKFIHVYIYDVVLVSMTLHEHLEKVTLVYDSILLAKLKLLARARKFFIAKSEFEVLCIITSSNAVRGDPIKVNRIAPACI